MYSRPVSQAFFSSSYGTGPRIRRTRISHLPENRLQEIQVFSGLGKFAHQELAMNDVEDVAEEVDDVGSDRVEKGCSEVLIYWRQHYQYLCHGRNRTRLKVKRAPEWNRAL